VSVPHILKEAECLFESAAADEESQDKQGGTADKSLQLDQIQNILEPFGRSTSSFSRSKPFPGVSQCFCCTLLHGAGNCDQRQ